MVAASSLLSVLVFPLHTWAQGESRMVAFEFRGFDANRVRGHLLELFVDRSNLRDAQVLSVPVDRHIESYDRDEISELLRPESVHVVLMGELEWGSTQPRIGRLRIALWTDRNESIDFEVPVQPSGRLGRAAKQTIAQRVVPILDRALRLSPGGAGPGEVGEPVLRPDSDSPNAPTGDSDSAEIQALRRELEALREEQTRLAEQMEQAQIEEDTRATANVSGGFILVSRWATWDDTATESGGLFAPGQFYTEFRGEYGLLSVNAEYRFVLTSPDNHGLYNTWLAFQLHDLVELKLGVLPVHFGVMPSVSHAFILSPLSSFGLEWQQELGAMLHFELGGFAANIGFFKTTERGPGGSADRWSFDVVRGDSDGDGVQDQDNEPLNQTNLWLTYTISHGDLGSTQFGLSGRYGFLFNHTTRRSGHQWAAAAHVHGRWGMFDFRLQAGRYEFHPKNPVGVSRDSVLLGGFSTLQPTSARANFGLVSLAANFSPTGWPVDFVQLFVEYTAILKDAVGHEPTQRLTPGINVSAEDLFFLLSVSLAKNDAGFGGDPLVAHVTGGDRVWETTFFLASGYSF